MLVKGSIERSDTTLFKSSFPFFETKSLTVASHPLILEGRSIELNDLSE